MIPLRFSHSEVELTSLFPKAFRNPPPAVASLFHDALTEDAEFKNTFREVTFAILDFGATSNLSAFKEEWKEVLDAQEANGGGTGGDPPEAGWSSDSSDGGGGGSALQAAQAIAERTVAMDKKGKGVQKGA